MMPYYSFPFYYDRNSMNMPAMSPMQQPMPLNQAPQMLPDYMQQPNMIQQPMMQQNMMPHMMMQQPMQMPNQTMPTCPCMQQMPMYSNNVMSMYPYGTMTSMPTMPGMEGIQGMEEMDMTEGMDVMDLSPMQTRPEDPPPVLSNNPATTSIVLFKELTGYPNYGNPSGNADILYTGNRGVWTFDVPAFLFVPGNLRAQLVVRVALDDHYDVPVNRYTARITVNGNQVHSGRIPGAQHGTPAGGRFNNWRELTFDINLRRNNRIVIVNTSNTGPNDWIAFDWMELRLRPR